MKTAEWIFGRQSLEYWGPNGMVFFRSVQVRWMPLQGDNSVTIALERPGASADQGTYSGHIEIANVVPQFKYYMNDAPVDVSIKNTFSKTISPIKGVPLPVLGVVSFLDHTWSSRFTSSDGFSMLNIENSDAQLPRVFHRGYYALGNLLYHPLNESPSEASFSFAGVSTSRMDSM